ncbi:MAG: lysophospholipase [Cyanobacteria bacterium P01_D01_bin.14]
MSLSSFMPSAQHSLKTGQFRTGTFTGVRQLQLYYQVWLPSGPTKANIILIHGLGEHIDRYHHVAKTFNQSGYALWAFDNLGHGRSDGQRGHIERWSDYTENIGQFLTLVKAQSPHYPCFIYGHSLGALMTLVYVLKQPEGLGGLVLSAPPIQPSGVEKPWIKAFAKTFSQLLPRLSLSLGLGTESLSRDPKVVRRAEADPLMHSVATLRWGTETIDAIATVRENAHQLRLPILLLHGDADKISDVSGSHELFEAITYSDKTLLIYPDSYHELHNDLERDQVLQDIVIWLDNHLPSNP